MSADPGLPPFGVVDAALRRTTERLVRELASPQPSAPDWSPFEWSVARATCAIHGISALLASRLKWQGAPGFHAFLDRQRAHSRQRDQKIAALLDRLDA